MTKKKTIHETREYALYKGEEVLSIGTIKEIANQLKVAESTIRFYKRPAYIKRRENSKTGNYRILIPLDD